MKKNILLPLLLASTFSTTLGGCALPVVVGAAAGAGYVGFQQRPTRQIAEDTDLKLSIKRELTRRYYAYFADVGVDVFYGNVLLTGIVPTAAEGEKVVALARQMNGTKRVYNELITGAEYTTAQKTRDAWIAAQIKPRLLGAEDAYPLNYLVTVVTSHVYIMGSAATAAEKNHVLHLLRTTKGVEKVHDYLVVEGSPAQEGRPNVVKQEDFFSGATWRQVNPLADE